MVSGCLQHSQVKSFISITLWGDLRNTSIQTTGDEFTKGQERGALGVNLNQSLLYSYNVSDPDSYFEVNTLWGGYHGEEKSLQC